jgi:hypothetical protein
MGECDDEIEKPPLYAGNFSFAGRSIVVRIDLQGRGVKGEAGFDGAFQEVRMMHDAFSIVYLGNRLRRSKICSFGRAHVKIFQSAVGQQGRPFWRFHLLAPVSSG